MKISKIALASIILLVILTLGAVSASDEMDNLTAVEDTSISPVDVIASYDDSVDEVGRTDDHVLGDYINSSVSGDFLLDEEISVVTWTPIFGQESYYSGVNVTYTFATDFENTSVTYSVVDDFNPQWISDAEGNSWVNFAHRENYRIKHFGALNITVDYYIDDAYSPVTETFQYFIKNTDYNIYLERKYEDYEELSEMEYMQDDLIKIHTPNDFRGNLTVTVNGKKHNIGYGSYWEGTHYYLNSSLFGYGENEYKISYNGDDVFAKFESELRTIYAEADFNYDYSITYLDDLTVTLTLPDDATGYIIVSDGYDEVYANQTVKGGINKVYVSGLSVGEHILKMKYIGNYPISSNEYFRYVSVDPRITVPEYALVGEDISVAVEGYDNMEGEIFLRLMGYSDEYDMDVALFSDSKVVKNGKANFKLPSLESGVYKVEVFQEDDYYPKQFDLYIINSTRIDFEISSLHEVILGESSWIYVGFPSYVSGYLSAYIDGKLLETIHIEDEGYVTFDFESDNMSLGKHNYEIRFTSDLFENASYYGNFEVVNIDIIIPESVCLNENFIKFICIACYLPKDMTGNITLYLDDFVFDKHIITSDDDYFLLKDIPVKDYDVKVVYSGDDKYPRVTKTGKVHLYYDMEINDYLLESGDRTILIQKPSNLCGGNLTVTIDGKVYHDELVVDDEPIEINVGDLAYGKHDVIAKYTGDKVYPASEVNKTIEVKQSISMPNQWSADSEVSLTLPGDAKGNLCVDIMAYDEDERNFVPYDKKEIPLVNGKATLSLADLELGDYYIVSSYSGRDYDVSSAKRRFTVEPVFNFIRNATIGGFNTISVESPIEGNFKIILKKMVHEANGDGFLEMFIENVPFVNNKAIYTFKNELLGEFELEASFRTSNSEVTYWYSYNAIPDYSLREETTFGAIENITVVMPKDTEGYVSAYISSSIFNSVWDVGVFNASFKDGVAIVNLPKLSSGSYRIYTEVITSNYGSSNSDWYNFLSKSTGGSILKDADLKIDVSDISEGQDAIINIEINDDATGTVSIVVDGRNVTAAISKGKASATISDLACGNYNVTAKYYGDDNVLGEIAFGEFNVVEAEAHIDNGTSSGNATDNNTPTVKVSPGLTVSVSDINVGDVARVVISIDNRVTGAVTVDGNVVNVADGVGSYDISGLKAGSYSVNVKFAGDDRFSADEKTVSFKVVEVETPDNGTSSGNATDSNSTSGNDDGNSTITKKDSGLTATASDINVGEVAKILISIDKDVTGTVTVDGKTVTVSNGAASYDISGLKAGEYNISVKFAGDNFFNADEKIVSFKVVEVETPDNGTSSGNATDSNSTSGNDDGNATIIKKYSGLTATASDINVGEVAKILISIDKDVTGAVTVDGKAVTVSNGAASCDISGLKAGDYSVRVRFAGDDFFNDDEITVSFKVIEVETPANNTNASTSGNATKPAPEIVIPPLDKSSSDGSVTVTLPADATGKVILSINGKNYSYSVENGVANVVIPNLGDGYYSYTITYSGDSKYASFTNEGSLKIDKTPVNPIENTTENVTDNTLITASPANVTYNAGSYYKITVYGADGKLADGVSVVVMVNGKAFKTLQSVNGIAKFKVTQIPGKYALTITALGKTITKDLTVNHLLKLKKVTVKKSAKKLVLTATLGKVNNKCLKNKKITFKFNGKKYTAKTDKKGVAKVTIKSSVLKKLKVGKKVTYQATYLKDTVKYNVKIKK